MRLTKPRAIVLVGTVAVAAVAVVSYLILRIRPDERGRRDAERDYAEGVAQWHLSGMLTADADVDSVWGLPTKGTG